MEDLFVVCQCSSEEHMLRFTFDDDLKYKQFYVSAHLSTYKGFWGRLWAGIKHAFGYRCKYGDWDEVLMKVEDAKKLKILLDEYIGDE